MDDKTIGINEEELKKLSIDMIVYEENFKKIQNEIEHIMIDSEKFLVGEIGNAYRQNYNIFKNDYKLVITNMHKYSEMFIKTISLYKKLDYTLGNKGGEI